MNLAIDSGNTRIKFGIFHNEQLVEQQIWQEWDLEKIIFLTTNQNVKNVILCNVGLDVPATIDAFLQQHFFYIRLDTQTPLPIQNAYKTPETLGKDRIAAVVGAFAMFPNQNCLAIDAGTCITYEFLTKTGVYLGGNIAPGLSMRLKAMHHFTAKLPLVEVGETENLIGYSTTSAMQNGAQWGVILEIEGIIDWCRSEWGEINVILTGGDANYFVKSLKSQIFVNPNLVLQGLNKILNYNVES